MINLMGRGRGREDIVRNHLLTVLSDIGVRRVG
jgi:hypothetical protein